MEDKLYKHGKRIEELENRFKYRDQVETVQNLERKEKKIKDNVDRANMLLD